VQICFLTRSVEECNFIPRPRQAWFVSANCPHHSINMESWPAGSARWRWRLPVLF